MYFNYVMKGVYTHTTDAIPSIRLWADTILDVLAPPVLTLRHHLAIVPHHLFRGGSTKFYLVGFMGVQSAPEKI